MLHNTPGSGGGGGGGNVGGGGGGGGGGGDDDGDTIRYIIRYNDKYNTHIRQYPQYILYIHMNLIIKANSCLVKLFCLKQKNSSALHGIRTCNTIIYINNYSS